MLPSDALNAVAAAAPIFLMGFFFGTAETGAFALVQRALLGPLTIVSGAVQEVFKSHLLQAHRAGEPIRRLFINTGLVLGAGGILLLLGGLFVAPPLLLLIFGGRWHQAALFAGAMAAYYAAKFVASPLSYIVIFFRRLRFDFWMHVFFLVGSVFAFCGGAERSALWAVMAYSLFMTFIYVMYVICSYRLVQREASH
jgi:O-antigen/teichoic acid export membrane protein